MGGLKSEYRNMPLALRSRITPTCSPYPSPTETGSITRVRDLPLRLLPGWSISSLPFMELVGILLAVAMSFEVSLPNVQVRMWQARPSIHRISWLGKSHCVSLTAANAQLTHVTFFRLRMSPLVEANSGRPGWDGPAQHSWIPQC